jgi:hypothetical protein
MSDHTTVRVSIDAASLPAGYAGAIEAIFESHIGQIEPWSNINDLEGTASVGAVEDLAADLVKLMKGRTDEDDDPQLPPFEFAFDAWQEPYNEYMGTLYRYRPGMNALFVAECDSGGNVQVGYSDLKDMLDNATSLDALRIGIRAAFGEA